MDIGSISNINGINNSIDSYKHIACKRSDGRHLILVGILFILAGVCVGYCMVTVWMNVLENTGNPFVSSDAGSCAPEAPRDENVPWDENAPWDENVPWDGNASWNGYAPWDADAPRDENALWDGNASQDRSTQVSAEDILETAADENIVTAWPTSDTDLIVIDPGHGGEDEGCERDGVQEKDINLQLALALRDRLTERGFDVVLTRDTDIALTMEERIEIANISGADIFVSIHQNSYEGKEASGMETWYSTATSGKDSSRLASLIQKYAIQFTEANDRGVVEDESLKVIREVKMPACLVETGFLSNAAERELLADAAYQEQIVEGLAYGIEYYFRPKTMYLTFDDGPSPEHTTAILDTLQEQNIKATFFVIGENVKKYPEVAERIVEEGHTIGIHCNNHDYEQVYESVDSFLTDFEAASAIVYEVTGMEPKIFRFPGGSINAYNKKVYQDIIAEMTERGYVYFDWNASLEDAVKKPVPEQLLKNAKESTLGRKKIVMLAHDTVYSTALCLEELIAQFPEYRMEPLSAEVEPIQFR